MNEPLTKEIEDKIREQRYSAWRKGLCCACDLPILEHMKSSLANDGVCVYCDNGQFRDGKGWEDFYPYGYRSLDETEEPEWKPFRQEAARRWGRRYLDVFRAEKKRELFDTIPDKFKKILRQLKEHGDDPGIDLTDFGSLPGEITVIDRNL